MSACLWQVPSKPSPGDGAISLGWSHIPEVGAKSLAVESHPWGWGHATGGAGHIIGGGTTSVGWGPIPGVGPCHHEWGHTLGGGVMSLGVEPHHWG